MKLVLANGVFELCHWGHRQHLKAARKMGDLLYVSITDDAHVNKGEGRPVFNQFQRAEMIRDLEYVHGVMIVESALQALQAFRPDIFVKGKEYKGKISQEDEEYCKEHGIEIAFTDEPVYSSTQLLRFYESGRS